MSLKPGDILHQRYEILRVLKVGGMGAIYEASDQRLGGSRCAVKEMLDTGGLPPYDADILERKFREEMAFLARLDHPNIPKVRDFFAAGPLYLVMEFIHGENLEDELKSYLELMGHPTPPEKVAVDALVILEVLDYLHNLDPPIIHRDIKPANLIRAYRSKKLTVVDFGLARCLADTSRTQTQVGTLGYCPVEQMRGEAEVRSDLYALGSTIRHLLTGTPPLPLQKQSILEIRPGLDSALAAIVDRARAYRPEDRFESAREMALALSRWRKGIEDAPAGEDDAPSPVRVTLQPSRGGASSLVAIAGRSRPAGPVLRNLALATTAVLALVFTLSLFPSRSSKPAGPVSPPVATTTPFPPARTPAPASPQPPPANRPQPPTRSPVAPQPRPRPSRTQTPGPGPAVAPLATRPYPVATRTANPRNTPPPSRPVRGTVPPVPVPSPGAAPPPQARVTVPGFGVEATPPPGWEVVRSTPTQFFMRAHDGQAWLRVDVRKERDGSDPQTVTEERYRKLEAFEVWEKVGPRRPARRGRFYSKRGEPSRYRDVFAKRRPNGEVVSVVLEVCCPGSPEDLWKEVYTFVVALNVAAHRPW